GLVGVAGDDVLAATTRVLDSLGGKRARLDLDEVDVPRRIDPGVLDRLADALGRHPGVHGRPELLWQQIARVRRAHREAFLPTGRSAVGLAGEDRGVRAHHALGPAWPDDGHVPGHGRELAARAAGDG